jgi:NADH-quinone oxidoreductase subunit L
MVHLTLFSDFVQKSLPATIMRANEPNEILLQLTAAALTILAVYMGYMLYKKYPDVIERWKQSEDMMMLRNFLYKGWSFDQLYDAVFVKPFLYITTINKSDVFDKLNAGIAKAGGWLNKLFSISQNGSLRWYVVGVCIGIIFILSLQFLL